MFFEASRISQLALPHYQNIPAQCVEGIQVTLISRAVAFDLGCPGACVVHRTLRALALVVSMPEAAMHKHDLSVAWQDDVGRAGKVAPV